MDSIDLKSYRTSWFLVLSCCVAYLQAGGFKYLLFHPYLGKIPILTHIFQMG